MFVSWISCYASLIFQPPRVRKCQNISLTHVESRSSNEAQTLRGDLIKHHYKLSTFSYRSEYRQAMMKNMSSTLVETVSIDYEDFNESFLTCGTCLCKTLKLFKWHRFHFVISHQVCMMAVNIRPNYCLVPTPCACIAWTESWQLLPEILANSDAPFAASSSLSHGVGCQHYHPRFLSTNSWIWWPDNAARSFPNVPPIKHR